MTDIELGSNAGDDAGLISGRPSAPVAARNTTPGKIAMMTLGSVAALFMLMGFFGESDSSRMVRVQAVDPTSLASVPDMPSKEEAKEHLKNAHATASKHISKALESEHAKKATKHAKAAWTSVSNWWSETTGLEEVEAEEKKELEKDEKKSEDKKAVEKKDDDKKEVKPAAPESSWYSGMTMSLRSKRRRKEVARRNRQKKQHESTEEQKDKPQVQSEDVVNGGWGMIPSWDDVTGWFN